jgi:hypothetical protein
VLFRDVYRQNIVDDKKDNFLGMEGSGCVENILPIEIENDGGYQKSLGGEPLINENDGVYQKSLGGERLINENDGGYQKSLGGEPLIDENDGVYQKSLGGERLIDENDECGSEKCVSEKVLSQIVNVEINNKRKLINDNDALLSNETKRKFIGSDNESNVAINNKFESVVVVVEDGRDSKIDLNCGEKCGEFDNKIVGDEKVVCSDDECLPEINVSDSE